MRKLLLALVLLIAPLHVFAAGPCAKSASPPNNTSLADGTPVPCYEDGNGNQYVLVTAGSAATAYWVQIAQAGTALSASNPLFSSIVQGGNTAQVTSGGSLVVSGQTAVGSAPTTPPVSVAGVDGGGLKRHILVDTDGAVHVVGDYAQASSTSGQLGVLGLSATTTSAPTYGTGTSNPDSTDVHGGKRTLIQGADGTPVNWDPTVAQAVNIVITGAQVTASAAGASTSNVVATLSGTAGKTTYISGFSVDCIPEASTAVNTTVTITGLLSGTQTYEFSESLLYRSTLMRDWSAQPLIASTSNTNIVVTLTAITGGTTCSVNAEGYQL